MKNSASFVSSDSVSDSLYSLFLACFNYSSSSERFQRFNAYDSISWYVTTCRASASWIRALQRANPEKLLKFIISSDDHSSIGNVSAATTYLKQHCHLHD